VAEAKEKSDKMRVDFIERVKGEMSDEGREMSLLVIGG
jgi:hypothetical protein